MSKQVQQIEAEDQDTIASSKINFKTAFIILLALFPFISYLIGNSFHSTYLSAFGIEASAFPLSIQDTYLSASSAITYSFLAIWNWSETIFTNTTAISLSTLFLISLVICIYILLNDKEFLAKLKGELPTSSKIQNYFSSLHKNFKRLIGLILMTFSMMYLLATVPFVLMTAWFSVYVLGASQGLIQANKAIDSYKESGECLYKKDALWSKCSQLNDSKGNLLHKGILVALNDKRVAFYNGKESVILEIPSGAVIKKIANPDIKGTHSGKE